MSKISTVYDQLITTIAALSGYTTKDRIPNPYSIEDNNLTLLRDSWGLKLNGAVAIPEFEQFKATWSRYEMELVLTREVIKVASDVTKLDTQTKSMLEDLVTARLSLVSDNQIGIPLSIEQIRVTSDTAIDFILESRVLLGSLIFEIDISEDL